MLKKYLTMGLLSLAVSTAYADAAINIDVPGPEGKFVLSKAHYTYQFNNKTGKPFTFLMTVDGPNTVEMQCFHRERVELIDVAPKQTKSCTTDDAVRLTVKDPHQFDSRGTYQIVF